MRWIVTLYRGENHWDFQKAWKWGIRISAALFVISVASLTFRGLNLGIDFEGGISWEVKSPTVQNLTVDQARDALRPVGLAEAKVQLLGTESLRVQATAESIEKQTQVQEVLGQLAGVPAGNVDVNTVGPSWGGEITQSALRALIVFLIAILGYVTLTFRGEWKLAVGVVVAVIHDIVISVGVYSVFRFEVTPATVIAFLTILGYSIYDTVVVYDKVQENTGRVGVSNRLTYSAMMSMSMNQVILRSINTSVVAVLPVLSTLIVGAYLLGAVTLEEFAIALTVGLTIGAYSSVFVAAPVVAWMKEREPRNRQLRQRLNETATKDKAKVKTPSGGSAVTAVVTNDSARDETSAVDAAGDTLVATKKASGSTSKTPTGTSSAPGAIDSSLYSKNHPPRPRKQGKKR